MDRNTTRRDLLRTAGFAAASILAPLGAPSRARNKNRLNVLFITADDLGLQLGCYGETLIQTPNLDKLAAGGVQFRTAYVAQASCSPSRSAMFTGLHTHSTGQYGLTNSGFALHPELRDKTIPNLLKSPGYRTGIIGKLHVAPEQSFQFDFRQVNTVNTRQVRRVADKADMFLRETGDQPFFLMVNYSDPHAFRDPKDRRKWNFPPQVDGLPANPLPPGEKTLFAFQQIDTPGQRVRTAGYYNAVQRLDDGIGMLMDVLNKHGYRENTLVIFIGDHGPPFARGKTTVYESGIRIPFIVRWPGVSRPMKSRAMVSTIDILPTILDATGVAPAGKMHGKSLRPVLKNADAPWREYLVAEFHFHGGRPFYPRRAIRDQRYKLIHNLLAGKAKPSSSIDADPAYRISQQSRYDGTPVRRAFDTFANPPEFELYDLKEDPVEFNNLAGKPEHHTVQNRLTEALLEYRRRTDDPFLDPGFVKKIDQRSRSKK
ncbi:MAG: sulfatase family protein [Planctomycetota bacterium]|jgi:N-sulfoglucosamine sulfohydrolase